MVFDRSIIDKAIGSACRGYWHAGGAYFLDKIECLRYATQNNLGVTYHYHDDTFGSLDWSKEPSQTLEQLYIERAKQLRDKYEYLILSFSGGADSTNILDIYLNNNIPLDEIVCYYPIAAMEKFLPTFKKEDKSNYNLMFEYVEAALPKLKDVSNKHPNIKITIIDYTTDAIDLIIKGDVRAISASGSYISPTVTGVLGVARVARERSMEKGNVGLIVGIDKPKIKLEEGKFLAYFSDFHASWGYHREFLDGFDPNIEYFYYSPESPIILVKQCALIKQALDPILSSNPRPEICKNFVAKTGKYEYLNTHDDIFEQIIYSNYDSSIYQVEKPSSLYYHEATLWLRTGLTDDKVKSFYDAQILEHLAGVDNRFITYKNNKPSRLVQFHTRTYLI